ncbi:unnamed protein product [Cochlearia groenlandica]
MASSSAVFSGARSMLRGASSRGVAASSGRFASQSKSAPTPMYRATTRRSSLLSPLRNHPVEMSVCVDSLLPYHTATASALMTSMLSISAHSSFSWLSNACNDDV